MVSQHVPEVLSTGAFIHAIFDRSTPGRYRVRFEARSREALDSYLSNDAPGLREDFARRFPAGIDVSREEWAVIENFSPHEKT